MSAIGGLQLFLYITLGLFGLLFGSFANVLIWRIPRAESIVSPPSHCPECDHPIRWHDNIPVVSWLVLRGKCRDCGSPIAWRYPAVEATSAALWMLAYWRYGLGPALPLAIVFFYMLLVLSVIDIDTRRLPTPAVAVIALAGIVAAIAASVTGVPFGPLTLVGHAGDSWLLNPVLYAASGFLLGGGTSVGVAGLYGLIRKQNGLGFGDVRMLGAMGLVLGPYVLFAYALANVLGVFFAVPVLVRSRRSATEPVPVVAEHDFADAESADFWARDSECTVPHSADSPTEESALVDQADLDTSDGRRQPVSIQFGPFLAVASIVVSLWGPALWGAYLRMLHIG